MSKPAVLVVDIPANATREETQRLVNEPLADGYYFGSVCSGFSDVAARAFFRLRVDKKPLTRKDRDGMETPALAFISGNMDMSLRKIQTALEAIGIKRRKDWIQQKKVSIRGLAARVE